MGRRRKISSSRQYIILWERPGKSLPDDAGLRWEMHCFLSWELSSLDTRSRRLRLREVTQEGKPFFFSDAVYMIIINSTPPRGFGSLWLHYRLRSPLSFFAWRYDTEQNLSEERAVTMCQQDNL